MMLRKLAVAFVLMVSALSVSASSDALIGALTSSLGVTEGQAKGGAGSMFGYAKNEMSPTDFSSLSSSVPGIDGLISAAPKGNVGGGSSGSSLLSGAMNQLGGTALLASQFTELGLDPSDVQKFLPVVLDYVETTGGDAAMKLLQSAF